jgi:hypothetical protein
MTVLVDPGAPESRSELLATLERVVSDAREWLLTMRSVEFFAPQGDRWSPAEHVRHLRKSSAPLVYAYGLPRILLRLRFGRARRPSRGFVELRDAYRAALGAGGQAGRFTPSPERAPADPSLRQREIMQAWQLTNAELLRRVRRWSETSLDAVLLPHPLLGKLTAREMLQFTVYHTAHHLNLVLSRLATRGAGSSEDLPSRLGQIGS